MKNLIRFTLISIVFFIPIFSHAATLWWVNGVTDNDQWTEAGNWAVSSPHGHQLPDDQYKLYITTSDHIHLGNPVGENPLSILDVFSNPGSPTEYLLRETYIGGWDDSDLTLPNDLGDPNDHEGILNIVDGKIKLKRLSTGSPKCRYLRIGSYGADGTINQTGGKVSGCTKFTFGFWSPDSTGHWNFDGGDIETSGLTLGDQGTGIFDMSGGQLLSLRGDLDGQGIPIEPQSNSDWYANGLTSIGGGYDHDDGEGYIPGVGLFNQIGGLVEVNTVQVARGPATVGVLAVRKDAEYHVAEAITIGQRGKGTFLQTGGVAKLAKVYIGTREGGFGELTLRGGEFHQIGGPGVFNGWYLDDAGYGNVSVVGSKASIQIDGAYHQYDNSRISFLLDNTATHVSRINVDGMISFNNADNEIDIMLLKATDQSGISSDLYVPDDGDKIVLMKSLTAINGVQNLTPTPRSTNWKISREDVIGGAYELVATYCPLGTMAVACL